MDHHETRSWVGWGRHMLMVFIAQLFTLKMTHKFGVKKGTQLKTPTVARPTPIEEYTETVLEHQNNKKVSHPNIIVEAKAAARFLTIRATMKLITEFLIMRGNIFRHINYIVQNKASSYDSHSRKTNKALMPRFQGDET
jgi:hypothetical protein